MALPANLDRPTTIRPDVAATNRFTRRHFYMGLGVVVLGTGIAAYAGALPTVATVRATAAKVWARIPSMLRAVSARLYVNGSATVLGKCALGCSAVAVTLYTLSRLMSFEIRALTLNIIAELSLFEFESKAGYGETLDTLRRDLWNKICPQVSWVRAMTDAEVALDAGFEAFQAQLTLENARPLQEVIDERVTAALNKPAVVNSLAEKARISLAEYMQAHAGEAIDQTAMNAIEEGIIQRHTDAEKASLTRKITSEVEAERRYPASTAINRHRENLLKAAKAHDITSGPKLKDMLTHVLSKGKMEHFFTKLEGKQAELKAKGFADSDLEAIRGFLAKFDDKQLSAFLRSNETGDLLKLDKIFMDLRVAGKPVYMPILKTGELKDFTVSDNGKLVEGAAVDTVTEADGTVRTMTREEAAAKSKEISAQLKGNLFEALFNEDVFKIVKDPKFKDKLSSDAIDKVLKNLKPAQSGLKEMTEDDLKVFRSPAGILLFFFLYQARVLEAVAEVGVDRVNAGFREFEAGMGNATVRADNIVDQIRTNRIDVLFTQEADRLLRDKLVADAGFHALTGQIPVDAQATPEQQQAGLDKEGNPVRVDGTFVFLKRSQWDAPQVLEIDQSEYPAAKQRRMNIVKSTARNGDKFIFASCHGDSQSAGDGRLQIKIILDRYFAEMRKPGNENLQLMIGTDANTKVNAKGVEEDLALFRQMARERGLEITDAGPTTIKCRMDTVMHKKAGVRVLSQGDFLLRWIGNRVSTLYKVAEVTVGFSTTRPNPNETIPSAANRSDHFPVGWKLVRRYSMLEVLPQLFRSAARIISRRFR